MLSFTLASSALGLILQHFMRKIRLQIPRLWIRTATSNQFPITIVADRRLHQRWGGLTTWMSCVAQTQTWSYAPPQLSQGTRWRREQGWDKQFLNTFEDFRQWWRQNATYLQLIRLRQLGFQLSHLHPFITESMLQPFDFFLKFLHRDNGVLPVDHQRRAGLFLLLKLCDFFAKKLDVQFFALQSFFQALYLN